MLRYRSIAFRLTCLILSCVAVVFAIFFVYSYQLSGKLVRENAEQSGRHQAVATVNRIETMMTAIQKVPESMALFFENSDYSKEYVNTITHAAVKNNPEIFGSTTALEPFSLGSDTKYFAPYYYRLEGKIVFSDLGTEEYNYPKWGWFSLPREKNHPVWSEPYYDEGGGNIIMTTYSVPFYKNTGGKREFQGVITADVSLVWLQEMLDSLKIYDTGYAFLISDKGTIITHPDKSLIMKETVFTIAERPGKDYLKEIGEQMVGGKTGFVPISDLAIGRECLLYYTPLPSVGWSLGIVFPQDEFMADVYHLGGTIAFLGLSGFVVIFVVIIIIAKSITNPLKTVTDAAEAIAEGDLKRAAEISEEIIPASLDGRELSKDPTPDHEGRPGQIKNETLRLSWAISAMIASLESLLSQVRLSGVQVDDSATQIATSARQLEATAVEQAASSNQVVSTTEKISSTADNLAAAMNKITKKVSQTAELSSTGIESLYEIKSTMQDVLQSAMEISDTLKVVSEKADDIGEIILFMTKIANQTNLLSLNAAIESEKAGKYGAGFSVVSREIRRLADQTSVAALDIEQMILAVQSAMKEGVSAVGKYTTEAREGSEKITGIIEDLRQVIEYIRKLEPEFESVNQVTQRQSKSAGQISETMEQLNETTNLTRNALGEFNQVTEQLVESVKRLQQEMERFSI